MPPSRLAASPPSVVVCISVTNLNYWRQYHPLRYYHILLVNVHPQYLCSHFLEYTCRCRASSGPVPLPLGHLTHFISEETHMHPSRFLDIAVNKTQVSSPKSNTACTTPQYKIYDTHGSAPSPRRSSSTCLDFFVRIIGKIWKCFPLILKMINN